MSRRRVAISAGCVLVLTTVMIVNVVIWMVTCPAPDSTPGPTSAPRLTLIDEEHPLTAEEQHTIQVLAPTLMANEGADFIMLSAMVVQQSLNDESLITFPVAPMTDEALQTATE